MTGSVKFGDGSKVEIYGRGTIIFWFQNGEHRALTDVYYIPQLCSSIISIGTLDEHECKVLVNSGMLRIWDRERWFLAKVHHSRNCFYMLDLKVEQPLCPV